MSAPTAPEAAQLRRTLGLPSVLLFGLAYMAPMIVYGTYGVLATASHGTVALAYLLALGAVIFTAMSYGRLAGIFPVAGSAYAYTRRAFNAHVGFVVGWAVLLVSHDREFIDQVVTSTLVFEGGGKIGQYIGGYVDWLRQRPPASVVRSRKTVAASRPASAPVSVRYKLSYREQRELDALPAQIETLEQQQRQLQQRLADPAIYRDQAAQAATLGRNLTELEQIGRASCRERV